jgi:C4-dicarboxylate-specific signal transduction histidine kinase
VRQSRVNNVEQLSALFQEHRADIASFFTTHPKGKQVLDYLPVLATRLLAEQAGLVKEIEHMRQNIEHVKTIVMMQQSFAKVSGVTERVKIVELVEDALRLNSSSMIRHDVEVIRDYAPDAPEITVERHKVLQILINLIRNAKFACDESGRSDKRVTVRIGNREGRVEISVADNGIGILPQNMTRIFNHGFTTRKHGHGFGLHSGALAAREMGGTLTAHSDGLGTGALFTLELPLEPPQRNKLAQLDAGDLSVRE